MLFRLVRPVKRSGSRNRYFVKRIPADLKHAAAGLKLSIPIGTQFCRVAISKRADSIRLSLRTDDPAEVKVRVAAVDAYLENVWRALREKKPIELGHRQATALAGELYRAWAGGEDRERTIAIEHVPGVGWHRVDPGPLEPEEWEAAERHLEKLAASGESGDLEKPFGPIVDRLLLSKGIKAVETASREILLKAFWLALRDALASRKRNAEGDYSPDKNSERFPEWVSPAEQSKSALPRVSLTSLVEEWWIEAKATGRKPSTHESYTNTMRLFVDYLGHDDASRITRNDVIGFKNHRLATVSERTGKAVSAKTVKDSDLSGLKTIFGWAKVNGKMDDNPAEGITIKLGQPRKLRSKGFTDAEAKAILSAARSVKQGNERSTTYAAKQWVPWLSAYTGARVGEIAQLRKKDVRREGKHWVISITPEAGTVKTNEARDVVLHTHLIKLGFIKFVDSAPPGHLFLKPSESGDVLGPLQGLKNRLAEFVRGVVTDPNVAPNHAWRHRFKTVGMEAGIEHRILDAIQGQRPRNIAESYGDVTIRAQASAIAKLPYYKAV